MPSDSQLFSAPGGLLTDGGSSSEDDEQAAWPTKQQVLDDLDLDDDLEGNSLLSASGEGGWSQKYVL